MWSLISTGVPGDQRRSQAAAAVGQHDGAAAGGGGRADAVHDGARRRGPRRSGCGRGRPAAFVSPARTERILPACPATAGGAKPGRSVVAISAVASPSASAAGSQPEPITRATSWRSTPVGSARHARPRRRRRRASRSCVAWASLTPERPLSRRSRPAGPGAQVGDVVVRGAGGLGGVGDDAEVAGGRAARPRRRRGRRARPDCSPSRVVHPHPDLAVEPGVGALPARPGRARPRR